MARHLAPGGILIVEPWFTPGTWVPGTVHALFIDEPGLRIARVNTSFAEGRLSYFDLHYLIGTPEGTEHLVERHELGLFERDEMVAAFEAAGLGCRHGAAIPAAHPAGPASGSVQRLLWPWLFRAVQDILPFTLMALSAIS